ncbi:MAG: DUF1566 domain-containing protein [bacterium]|nr:DUF1566 domain-containing protein [bacterium]
MKPTTCAAGLILIILAMLPGTGCGSSEMKLPEGGVVKLRAEYKALSESDVKSLLKNRGFFDRRWNRTGGFPNRFKSQTVNDEKIVADLATNLTWHQSGSQLPITLEDAETWLKELNDKKYAGYSGWRLPTLEEALSLLERKAVDRYHIDPLFSRLQYSMWTGDIYSEIRAWGISFNYGRVFKARFNEGDFVRPVRTGVPKK